MGNLKAGFARVDITPMLGIAVRGYFKPRFADGVLDPLEANAVAFENDGVRAVVISVDNCGMPQSVHDPIRRRIAEVTGIPFEGIFIHATHTHTGPETGFDSEDELIREYTNTLLRKLADVSVLALQDLKPARMGWAIGNAPGIAFGRRYRMKDGSVQTNPGVNNPEIDGPIGEVDERVNVVRFDREGGDTIVVVNFGCHPDTVGGCAISADWPGFLRMRVEKALDNTKCIFFNGAQGDINHVNVQPKGGFLNDLFMDFDDVARGYGHARHMGNVVAGAVLQVYDKVRYEEETAVRFVQNTFGVPSQMPKPEDMPNAYAIEELHRAGKDDEIPFKGMMLTTVVAEAERMIALEHGPEAFDMIMGAVAVGDVVFLGIPGEPFTGIGLAVKQAPGWKLVMPCCNTDTKEGYFPMNDAYEEGGYEARGSRFRAGVSDVIIREGLAALAQLRD